MISFLANLRLFLLLLLVSSVGSPENMTRTSQYTNVDDLRGLRTLEYSS